MSTLAPPASLDHDTEDAGAHELESSDDHFSDASEGQKTHSRTSSNSPIPVMRVERVDETPAYGEVPGTAAYKMRAQDAVPDEIEVIPDGQRSRSASRVSESDRPSTPGGPTIPRTIVEKVEPDNPSYGEVPGTEAYEKRKADAEPDEIMKSPIKTRMNLEGEPTSSRSELPDRTKALVDEIDKPPDEEDDGEGFGDDFDDFEEGEEVDEDDFGDFGETAVEMDSTNIKPSSASPLRQPEDPLEGLPPLSFTTLDTNHDIDDILAQHLRAILPDLESIKQAATRESRTPEPLLSDRSASLWAQLVAPPPLQPPNWTKSRTRRLFLVSLGVPVDLDEILPASKQKKLVLPSIHMGDENDPSLHPSSQLNRVLQANTSSTSVDSAADSKHGSTRGPEHKNKDRTSKRSKSKTGHERAGPPPPPPLDTNAVSHMCQTTELALKGLPDAELRAHVEALQARIEDANKVLEYWLVRKDSALGDKEAFEGVIENLVGFVARAKGTKGKR